MYNKRMMSGQDCWRENAKSNVESGIHARFYRAPDGTIFRSKTCLLKFLVDEGRLDEYQMLKKMQLHRKHSFQV